MSTWILRMDAPGEGPRLAIKDAIDVEGVPTTVGCAAVADAALAASADAPCVATARAAGARIVGKTNLHELCFGTAGTNPWYGNPVNPLAPDLVPGGSSSGSAVAVATDEADIALGTDTGGSVRIPAACCGVVGLKTTWGRVPLEGVWPLAPTLDTVGPIARTVADVAHGMAWLAPGFAPSVAPARTIGRIRVTEVDSAIEDDVDRALRAGGFDVIDIDLPGLATAGDPFTVIILGEAWASDAHLLEHADRVGSNTRGRIESGRGYGAADLARALTARAAWQDEVRQAFDRCEVFALPTLFADPPGVGADGVANALCHPWNLAGVPAISLPIGARRPVPSSLQLVGPWLREDLLCATATVVEAAR